MPSPYADAIGKLESLRRHYVDDIPSQRKLDEIEKRLRQAVVAEALAGSPAIKLIVQAGISEIRNINLVLLSPDKLEEGDRRLLVREREVHEFYLSRFSPEFAQKSADQLIDYIQRELKIAESGELPQEDA